MFGPRTRIESIWHAAVGNGYDNDEAARWRCRADMIKQGETDMGDKGKKDKGKREQRKKAHRTLEEKRRMKKEKKQNR